MAAAKKHAGGRPPMADRTKVKSSVLTLRLSGRERRLLERLVAQHAKELEQLTGERVEVTMASYMRGLLAQAKREKK